MMHNIMAGGASANLTSEQEFCIEFCRNKLAEIRKDVFKDKTPVVHVEENLDFGDRTEFGHADRIEVSGPVGLVVDYKFGRDPVDPAEQNIQLRTYAVMTAEKFMLTTVFAVVLQPRLGRNGVSISAYQQEDLEKARAEIRTIIANPSRELIEGPHCKYCRAMAVCQRMVQKSQELTIVDQNAITPGNAAEIYRRCKVVEKHLGALKARVHFMVETAEAEGRKIPGLSMKPGRKIRTVEDAQEAFTKLHDILTVEQFTGCCKVSIGDLEETFIQARKAKADGGKISLKKCKEELTGILGETLTAKQGKTQMVLEDENQEIPPED